MIIWCFKCLNEKELRDGSCSICENSNNSNEIYSFYLNICALFHCFWFKFNCLFHPCVNYSIKKAQIKYQNTIETKLKNETKTKNENENINISTNTNNETIEFKCNRNQKFTTK